MTRDSAVFKIVPLLAMLAGVFVGTVSNPADYGLSDITMRWIAMGATMLGTISAWLGTSVLPGKNDKNKLSGGGPRSFLLPFLLVATAAGASGCGGGFQVQMPSVTPTQEQAAEINRRAVQAAEIGTAVIGIADKALDAVHRVVPPSQLRLDINAGFDVFGAAMENIAVRAQDIVEDLTLQNFVQEILKATDDLLGVLEKVNHPDVSKYAAEIRDKVALLRAMVGGVQ